MVQISTTASVRHNFKDVAAAETSELIQTENVAPLTGSCYEHSHQLLSFVNMAGKSFCDFQTQFSVYKTSLLYYDFRGVRNGRLFFVMRKHSKDCATMSRKKLQLLLLYLLPISAQASVEIVNIEVLDSSYYGHRVRLTLDHDGSLGDDVFFGATPLVHNPVFGFSYNPIPLEDGVFTAIAMLSRPKVANQLSFSSYGVLLHFYNRSESVDLTLREPLELEWPSLSDSYGIETSTAASDYSVKHLEINGRMYQFDEVLRFLSKHGMPLNDIDISTSGKQAEKPASMVPLYASEDVEFDDLMAIIRLMNDTGTRISTLGFYALTDQRYPLGHVSLGIFKLREGANLSNPAFEQVLSATSKEQLFDVTGFTPTPLDVFVESTMQRAIAYIDKGYRSDAERASELLDRVLEKDPGHVRAYVEMARAEVYQHGLDGLAAAKNTIQFALSLDSNNPYANQYAGFIEMREGNYEEALEYFARTQDNLTDEIVWLTNNWGYTLRMMGQPELARARYEQLMLLTDLDSYNANALQIGLEQYASLLEEMNDERVIAVYEKLYREFPERSGCVPVDLARHQILSVQNSVRAKEWLDLTVGQDCEDADSVAGLIRVTEWFSRNGSRPELFRAMASSSDRGQLVYLLAGMSNGETLLGRLAESGISLNEPDSNGMSPVFQALEQGNHVALENLALAGAELNSPDIAGMTTLLNAVFRLDEEAVRILLAHGADPAATTPLGFSVLDLIDQIESTTIVEMLGGYAGRSV